MLIADRMDFFYSEEYKCYCSVVELLSEGKGCWRWAAPKEIVVLAKAVKNKHDLKFDGREILLTKPL